MKTQAPRRSKPQGAFLFIIIRRSKFFYFSYCVFFAKAVYVNNLIELFKPCCIMTKKSSTQAVLALMQDAQQLKRVCGWRKTTVEFYSDYIDAEYRTTDTVRAIPNHVADEWRMYASNDEIVFVFTYYYDPDL